MIYDIFIVDDEPLIVDGLICFITEELKLPVRVTGYAYSGEDAFEKIKELRPHIILSDIRMKQLSGLDLAGQVKTLLPASKVMLLTGFNDFTYIQTAIRQKVFRYLLKPIDGNELKDSILKAIVEIEEHAKSVTDMNRLQSYLEKSRPYIRDIFFSYIKEDIDSNNQLDTFMSVFNIPANTSMFIPVYIAFLHNNSLFASDAFSDASQLFSLIDRMLSDNGIAHLSFFDSDALVVVLMLNAENSAPASCNSYLENICTLIEFNSDSPFSIGVGRATEAIYDLPKEYVHAKASIRYRFYFGDNKIIFYNDLDAINNGCVLNDISEHKENLTAAIVVCHREVAFAELDSYYLALCVNNPALSDIKERSTELFLGLFSSVNNIALGKSISEEETLQIVSSVWRCNSVKEIKTMIKEFIRSSIITLEDKRTGKNMRIVQHIKTIINEKYQTITLDAICEEIGFSPSYTSNLFSNLEKITIKDFIISRKVDEAKTLLKKQSSKVYEIADAVGYTDAKYFSQVFKKYTGMTPEQFRTFQ